VSCCSWWLTLCFGRDTSGCGHSPSGGHWPAFFCLPLQPHFLGPPPAPLEATCVWTQASARNTSLCVQEPTAWSGTRFTHPCCLCCARPRWSSRPGSSFWLLFCCS